MARIEVRYSSMKAYPSIKASCFMCGDVMLTIDDIHVFVEELGGRGKYAFDCPTCSTTVTHDAAASTCQALMSAGVLYSIISPELMEPRGSGAPVTHDEVLDFHNLLQDDEAIAAFFEN